MKSISQILHRANELNDEALEIAQSEVKTPAELLARNHHVAVRLYLIAELMSILEEHDKAIAYFESAERFARKLVIALQLKE